MQERTVRTPPGLVQSTERTIEESSPQRSGRRLNLDVPLVPAEGRKPFDLTAEQIYELIEFP